MRSVLLVVTIVLTACSCRAQNCAGTSTGEVPINDLGAALYQGFEGGLYPGGGNAIPPAHLADGLAAAAAIVPLDASGAPSADGRVVLLSIGLSNTTIEFSRWMAFNDAAMNRASQLVVVDGAQGGVDADEMSDPSNPYWSNTVPARLAARHVTAEQVQAAWLKTSHAGPTGVFPQQQLAYRNRLADIVRIAKLRFPNLRICYISSRIYAGYGIGNLSPEPYAYETGFGVKWVIEAQMNDHPAVNHDPSVGAVNAPWLGWGPYLWADGVNPRSDGLTYECLDLRQDGFHPGIGASIKVRDLMEQHFTTNPTATPWFLGSGGPTAGGVRAQSVPYGSASGCAGAGGLAGLGFTGTPFLGNPAFNVFVQNVSPGAISYFLVSLAPGLIDVGHFCGIHVSLDPAHLVAPSAAFDTAVAANAQGVAGFTLAIPNIPAIEGFELFTEWAVVEPTAPGFLLTTRGLELVLGPQ